MEDRLFDRQELAENHRAEAEFRGIGRTNVGFLVVGLGSMSGGGASRKAGDRVGSGTINRRQVGVQGAPEVGRWDFRGGGLRGRDL